MTKRLSFALPGGAALLGLALIACGGGGEDDGAGEGQRVTDPAEVPSSTPISNGEPQLYQIHQDGSLTISGGTPIAGTVPAGETPTNPDVYVVQSGDFCGTIAEAHGITVAELIAANRATINEDCTNLHAGDELRIPSGSGSGDAATPTPPAGGSDTTPMPRAGSRTYEVRDGDTCADIAASFGVSVEDLIALNGLDEGCQNLQIGQTLDIPG